MDKALTVNLILNSSIPASGGMLTGTVSNTGHFSFSVILEIQDHKTITVVTL